MLRFKGEYEQYPAKERRKLVKDVINSGDKRKMMMLSSMIPTIDEVENLTAAMTADTILQILHGQGYYYGYECERHTTNEIISYGELRKDQIKQQHLKSDEYINRHGNIVRRTPPVDKKRVAKEYTYVPKGTAYYRKEDRQAYINDVPVWPSRKNWEAYLDGGPEHQLRLWLNTQTRERRRAIRLTAKYRNISFLQAAKMFRQLLGE